MIPLNIIILLYKKNTKEGIRWDLLIVFVPEMTHEKMSCHLANIQHCLTVSTTCHQLMFFT